MKLWDTPLKRYTFSTMGKNKLYAILERTPLGRLANISCCLSSSVLNLIIMWDNIWSFIFLGNWFLAVKREAAWIASLYNAVKFVRYGHALEREVVLLVANSGQERREWKVDGMYCYGARHCQYWSIKERTKWGFKPQLLSFTCFTLVVW